MAATQGHSKQGLGPDRPAAPAGALPDPETPTGKGANDENFPVGSFLLPPALRPHVARYYAFARAADDISDNPDLAPEDKIARLDAFDAALAGEPGYGAGYEKAHALRASLAEAGVTPKHARDLLKAFRQDAVKLRYASWQELLDYCELSANPVGRFLLDLHGQDPAGYPYSDALCTALQILNHLQDCGDDLAALDRCYVPQDWLVQAGATTDDFRNTVPAQSVSAKLKRILKRLTGEEVSADDMRQPALTPALRKVLNRMLDGVDDLMRDARQLPAALTSRHLAMESAVIVNLAGRLARKLRRKDPLATRVALTRLDFALAGVTGIVTGFFAPRPADGLPREQPHEG